MPLLPVLVGLIAITAVSLIFLAARPEVTRVPGGKAFAFLLIFLAPKSQKFAVVGGTALHEKVGQAWWDGFIALLTRHFKDGHFTDGIVAALEKAGTALKTHFPDASPDRAGQKDIVED